METLDKTGDPDDPAKLPMYLSPYEVWNFGKGKGYAFPGIRKFSKHISALAEFRPPRAIPDHEPDEPAKGKLPTLWDEKGLMFLPFVVEKPFDRDIKDQNQLQRLLLGGLRQIAHRVETQFVNINNPRFRVAFPIPDRAMHEDLEDGSALPDWEPDPGLCERIGANKRIVIMAVIDDGLPFAHRNFRDASGRRTRVEFCWLQSAVIQKNQKSVLFGREYTRPQIDGLIAQYGNDEDTLYREAGAMADAEEYGSLIERHATHGGHVMDLATGYAQERGDDDPPEEIRIIAVQLPNTIALDTSGFGKDMYMLAAFHYIFNRVDLIAKKYKIEPPRLVINFSYGFSGGRHDGGTELEAAIDELIEMRRQRRGPTALVLPSGNTFLERLHGRIHDLDFHEGAASFRWRIQPNDRTPSYLELWFPKGFVPSGYAIELYDPWRRLRMRFPIEPHTSSTGGDPGNALDLPDDDGRPVGQISVDIHRADAADDEHKTGRFRVLVIMAPTEPENPRLPGIESGKWTVVITRNSSAMRLDHSIYCWIQRAADPDNLRSGSRQSYFDDLKDVRYGLDGDLKEEDTEDAFVRRFGSLNGLATGSASLVVAGFRLGAGLGSTLEDARPARYSAAWKLKAGELEAKVACSSMSDRSRVLTGTIAAGVRSGALSYVQGTSTAAPFVARRLATVFVTAEDRYVQNATAENYRSLLSDYYTLNSNEGTTSRNEDMMSSGDEGLTKARLGTVRVPPHWQPGLNIELLTGEKGKT
jgi:hypothetical protein